MPPPGLPSASLFGPLALKLGLRALPGPVALDRRASTTTGQRLHFALAARPGLAEEVLPRLEAAAPELSAYLPRRWSAAPPTEALLGCERAGLEGLAEQDELARVLLAAQAALERPPAPPRMMGVVNVTPDSFSDGGLFHDPGRAVAHALELVAEGATILDVGGESTRPGAQPVPTAEELARVLPVVEAVGAAWQGLVSIDTRNAAVARAALERGARMVNDVSAGSDPRMLEVVAEHEAELCLMHMRGEPATMQREPRYEDVLVEVAGFLRERVARCLKAGIDLSRIMIDPGIGFGKLLDHNLELLGRLIELRSLSLPILVGVSRKSFLAQAEARELTRAGGDEAASRSAAAGPATDRIGGTAAAVAACVRSGVDVLRVHDVRVMAQAARVAYAIHFPLEARPHPTDP